MKSIYKKIMLFMLTLFISGVAFAQPGNGCQQMTPYIIGGISNCVIDVTTKDQQGASPSGFTYTWKVNGLTIISNGTSNNFTYPVDESGTYNVTVIFTIPNSSPLCQASASVSYTAPTSCDTTPPPPPSCPSNQIAVNNAECTSTGGGDASANWHVNANHVQLIKWSYSLGPHNNIPLGNTPGNSNGMHQVNWNLETAGQPNPGNWDGYDLVVKAQARLVNGTWCSPYYKTIELNCPGGGGGTGGGPIGIIRPSRRDVVIVPNPVIDDFSVKSTKEIASITVRNLFGQMVTSINKDITQQIDLSNQVGGVYFIEIKFIDGSSESKKVILKK